MGTLNLLTPLSSSTNYQISTANQSNFYSHFQIRDAQQADLIDLAEVLASSFHSHQGILSWAYPILRLGIYEDLRNRLRSTSSNHICLIAVPADHSHRHASDIAGTVEMGLRSTDPFAKHRFRYPYISNLAVFPIYRRRGVATQLLLNCERVALTWGFQDLYLHVLESNHQARQLYFNLGYQLHKVEPSWNALLLGRPRQLFLHKHLSITSAS